MRRYLTLSLLSLTILCSCGTRGTLYLPPQSKTQPPAAGSPAPADVSTAQERSS